MKKFTRNVYILGIALALVAGLNAYVGLLHVNAPVRRELERKVEAELNSIISEVSATLTLVEKSLNTVGYYITKESDEEKIAYILTELRAQDPAYLGLYLGTPRDEITAPWYTAAVNAGRVAYTAGHEDSRVITASKPLFGPDRELLAVVAVDFCFENLPISGVVSRDRRIFFVSDDVELLGSYGHIDLHPADFREPRGVMEYQLESSRGYLAWEHVGESQLIAAAFASVEDTIGRGTQNKRILALTLLTFVVGSLVVFVVLRRHVVEPMSELGHDLMEISLDRDVTYRLPIRQNNSLGMFRQALNVSLHKAQEHHEHMMEQRAELAQAYKQLMEHEKMLQEQYAQIKENEAKIRFMADYDSLTGLLNRRRFQEDLEMVLQEEGEGAVLLLDIDDFKNINDTQGHSFGDDILTSVGRVLEKGIPRDATAYRFGGDEFVIIVRHRFAPERVQVYVEQIARELNTMGYKKGKKSGITCSMGVVMYPEDGTTVSDLLIKADVALHNAKNTGKNRHSFFEQGMAALFTERVQMEHVLAEAIRTGGFYLVYQPIVQAQTGKVACFEALVRLKDHPALPSLFVPIAEESDLSIPLGYWVITEVIRQLCVWQEEGKDPKPVAVNMSMKQFHDPNLLDFIRQKLRETGVDPTLLELEFMEGVLLDDAERALGIMEELRTLGLTLSLDNYGTGYSFIHYMTRIPVNYLKVHGILTENVEDNPDVMKGLISIAHGLGMEVVAEQVETLEEARVLMQANCDYLQGFLFSKPVVAHEAEQMFEMDYAPILGLEKREKEGSV